MINKDILFIINPHSGRRNAEKLFKKLTEPDINLSAIITKNLEELENVFKSNIENYKVFVVVGGDGSVNEATKFLINRNDKILAIYPAGSGNGFARELSFKKSVQQLLEDIKKGDSIEVDILSVNDNYCINVVGLGFDSFVAHRFQHSKTRGLKNYIVSTIKSAFDFKPFDAEIIVNSEKIKGKFQMITIANTRQFGNNAFVSPQSKPNDGIFEVVLVKPFPFYLYPSFVLKMFLGTLKESKYISYLGINDSVEIISGFKKYHVDGEPKIFDERLVIKMQENKIRVLKTSNARIL
jgi:YegS/Rv2252/BmrU family lipid kinase